MKTKSISVLVSRTINLGNFESLRLEAGSIIELEEGDDAAEASARALVEVRGSLREQLAALRPKKRPPKETTPAQVEEQPVAPKDDAP